MKPRSMMIMALGAALASVGSVADAGMNALRQLASSAPPPSFGQRYGGSPKSTGNRTGTHRTTTVARMKRAARKRNNIRKHARG